MSKQKSRARQLAVQAIYQWQMAEPDVGSIVLQFMENPANGKFDQSYFKDLLRGVTHNVDKIDDSISPMLDRKVESVDPVERAILRLGAYELLFHPEVPYRVVINESVELAKKFGAEKGHKYVNAVLDKLAQQTRVLEMRARS